MKLTKKERDALINALVDRDIRDDIDSGGGLLDSLLKNGCKGYSDFTDAELLSAAGEDLTADVMIELQADALHLGVTP